MFYKNAQKPLFLMGLFLLSFSTLPIKTYAEDLYSAIPESIKSDRSDFFTLTIENDIFGNGEDRNYTNGIRLSYFDYNAETPQFLSRFIDAIPALSLNETSSIYYSVGQNLYTPKTITTRTPDPSDRPYAAFLYGSAGFTTLQGNHIDDIEITAGIVGPWALGEEVQDSFHDLIDADDPSGWDHQLHNEPGLILSWQRRWPAAWDADYAGLNFRAIPNISASAGNIYTYASTGLMMQITPSAYSWQSLPPRVRPSIPGNGFFMVPDNQFAWSVFAGIDERLIARNIFLDGNSFRDSPSVDKNYAVTDASAGLSLSYGRAQMSYTLNWRSKEFKGQEDPSLFGAITLSYRY